jgi:putative transposase
MPWRETSAMEERLQLVMEVRENLGSFTEICARYSVSTKTGYKWIDRYEREGIAGLQDQSRAPKNHPNQISEEVKEAILAVRRAHATWGPKMENVDTHFLEMENVDTHFLGEGKRGHPLFL